MQLPPSLLFMKDTVYPATRDGWTGAQGAMQSIEDHVIDPAVNALLTAPEVVGEVTDPLILDRVLSPKDIAGYVRSAMGLNRGERQTFLRENPNTPNQITILPFTEDPAMGKRNMFTLLSESPNISGGSIDIEGDGIAAQPVFAPFSTLYPTALWPWADEDGSRYTVHDLGNEPLETDFLGTKPILSIITGRSLDKVGALPGFRFWGDFALGIPPSIFWTGIAVAAAMTAPTWGPYIGTNAAKIGIATMKGTVNLAHGIVTAPINAIRNTGN